MRTRAAQGLRAAMTFSIGWLTGATVFLLCIDPIATQHIVGHGIPIGDETYNTTINIVCGAIARDDWGDRIVYGWQHWSVFGEKSRGRLSTLFEESYDYKGIFSCYWQYPAKQWQDGNQVVYELTREGLSIRIVWEPADESVYLLKKTLTVTNVGFEDFISLRIIGGWDVDPTSEKINVRHNAPVPELYFQDTVCCAYYDYFSKPDEDTFGTEPITGPSEVFDLDEDTAISLGFNYGALSPGKSITVTEFAGILPNQNVSEALNEELQLPIASWQTPYVDDVRPSVFYAYGGAVYEPQTSPLCLAREDVCIASKRSCARSELEDGNVTCGGCASGLINVGNESVLDCRDVDECELDPCDETTAFCLNTFQAYECQCHPGFRPSSLSGNCVDDNECAISYEICPYEYGETCENTIGSFECNCIAGFESNLQWNRSALPSSFDVDCNHNHCYFVSNEALNWTAAANRCRELGGQLATIQSVQDFWRAREIYYRNGYGDAFTQPTWIGLSEAQDGRWQWVDGSFLENPINPRIIVSRSEGLDCGQYAHTGRWYDAKCSEEHAYLCEATTCNDVNECSTGAHQCPPGSECINTYGGHECRCLQGFEGAPGACADVDECEEQTHDCDSNAACTNTVGSFTCACNAGYHGSGTDCDDVDECAGGERCGMNEDCVNSVGSFVCVCTAGWERDSDLPDAECGVDVDECAVAAHSCLWSNGNECKNTIGSFSCDCVAGFDELAAWNPAEIPAEFHSACVGGKCFFVPPDETLDWVAAEERCEELGGHLASIHSDAEQQAVRELFAASGAEGTAQKMWIGASDLLEEGSFVWVDGSLGAFSHWIAGEPNNFFGQEHCAQMWHFGRWNDDVCWLQLLFVCSVQRCADVDECLTASACFPNNECTNTYGNYSCECSLGFAGPITECADVDECEEQTHDCDSNAACTNTVGSFTCACNAGYNGSGTDCDDVDECAGGERCGMSADCVNSVGSFVCVCTAGCVDSDGSFVGGCREVSMASTDGVLCTPWGAPQLQGPHCTEARSWRALGKAFGDRGAAAGMKTGGLGSLSLDGRFESWVCLQGHPCLDDASVDGASDDWMCFVYDEGNKTFRAWGKDSDIHLVGFRGVDVEYPPSSSRRRELAPGMGGGVSDLELRSFLEVHDLLPSAELLARAGVLKMGDLGVLGAEHVDLMMQLYGLPLVQAIRLKAALAEMGR